MKNLISYFINPILSILAIITISLNYLFIFVPFYIAIIPVVMYLKQNNIIYIPEFIFYYFIAGMFLLTLFYLFIDFLLGFSVKNLIKNTIEVKQIKDLAFHQELFEEILKKFNLNNVKFLLQENEEINAYAVATFGRKYLIITSGMIEHIQNSFELVNDRREAFKGLIGHELSHLINWDFLPDLILISGNHISLYTQNIILFLLQILKIIPFVGFILSELVYKLSSLIINIVQKFTNHIYILFNRFLGRLVEYRCDSQSAQILSWQTMYMTLYMLLPLNSSAYHSLYSTHPSTILRILNIYNKSSFKDKIDVKFIEKSFGLIALLFVTISFIYYIYYYPKLIDNFISIMHKKIVYIFNDIISFLNNFSTISINYSILQENSVYYFFIFILSISILLFITFIYKRLIVNLKIQLIKNKVNTTNDTPLDILLLHAIENNEINTFIILLEKGANFNSKYFKGSIYYFAEKYNKNFIKYLKKIERLPNV